MDIDVAKNCSGCSSLKMELDQKNKDMEQIGQNNVAAFLTLKQKILSIETLIRDYQTAKLECELQSRKVEELSRTITSLRQDLKIRTEEYSKILTSFEPIKEEKEKDALKLKKLELELDKWKDDADGAQSHIDQLTERVEQLKKYEKEKDTYFSMTKEHGKMKDKLDALSSQCKEAKERHSEVKKELKQSQRAYKKLLKSALLWGRLADMKGLFNAAQKRVYASLMEDHPDAVEIPPAQGVTIESPASHAEQTADITGISDDSRNDNKQQGSLQASTDIFKKPQVPELDIKATAKLDVQESSGETKTPTERSQPTGSIFDSPLLPDLEAMDGGGISELPALNGEMGNGPWGKRESPLQTKNSQLMVEEKTPSVLKEADDEIENIFRMVKQNLPSNSKIISPLPVSPEMDKKPVVRTEESISPVQENSSTSETKLAASEVKSRFPSLPRCAFNWAAKKLPISDKLSEKFGVSLHAGRNIRIRFRRIGSLMRSERSRESICKIYQGVVNFAEAEKPPPSVPEPIVASQEAGKEPESTETRVPSSSRLIDPLVASRPKLTDPFSPRPNLNPPSKAQLVTAVGTAHAPKPVHLPHNAVEVNIHEKFASVNTDEISVHRTQTRTPLLAKPVECHVQTALTTSKKKQTTRENLFGDSSDDELVRDTDVATSPYLLAKNSYSEERITVSHGSPVPPSPPNRVGLTRSAKFTTIRPVSSRITKPPIQPLQEFDGLIKNKTATRMVAPVKRPVESKSFLGPLPEGPTTESVEMHAATELTPSGKKRIAHSLKRELPYPDPSPESPTGKKPRSEDSSVFKIQSPPPEPSEPLQEATKPRLSSTVVLAVDTSPKSPIDSRMDTRENLQEIKSVTVGVTVPVSDAENVPSEVSVPEKVEESKAKEASEPDEPAKTPQGDCHQETRLPAEDQEPPSHCYTIEDTPQSPVADKTPQEPSDTEDAGNRLIPGDAVTVRAIPTSPVKALTKPSTTPLASAYEILKQLELVDHPTFATQRQGSKKQKKEINLYVNRYIKGDEESSNMSLTDAVDRVTRPVIREHPVTLVRHLIGIVVKDCSSPLDTRFTPPAPSLTTFQQRCIVLLLAADQKYLEGLLVGTTCAGDHFTDPFLDEISAVLFKRNSTFNLEEKSSLARLYTAICRLRGHLNRARTFLYDCLYFYPTEAYALTYTILSVWAEVLRHVTYPTGLSAMDQSVVYLLTKCNKISAVPGLPGKVLQVRSFIQNTYGYKNVGESSETINELLSHLINKLRETHSLDGCASLSWNLALLARWEGNDWGLMVIKEHLWPLLLRWSSGEGFDPSAAGAIRCIGLIGRRLSDKQLQEIKTILEVLKNLLLQSDGVSPLIQEAAIDVIVLLGPELIISILKEWKPRIPLTNHIKKVLDAFIRRQAKPTKNYGQDCEPSHCVNSFVVDK